MSPNAIIKGVKQRKAIEIELINKMKEELDFIADGMQKERYNRSDALSELRDKLQDDSSNVAISLTTEQKTELKETLRAADRHCEVAEQQSYDRYTREILQGTRDRETDRIAIESAKEKGRARRDRLHRRFDLVKKLVDNPTTIYWEMLAELRTDAKQWETDMKDLRKEDRQLWAKEQQRRDRATKARNEEVLAIQKQQGNLIVIAQAMGIDIYWREIS